MQNPYRYTWQLTHQPLPRKRSFHSSPLTTAITTPSLTTTSSHDYTMSHQLPRRAVSVRQAAGEIVEVQGGHIVRSIARKDRHSKVCTSKGPRDRRVRLSAHTAIKFYDVQDRLGYDRPSKAVDWLIKNAKAAIDELAELPSWHPSTTTLPPITTTSISVADQGMGASTTVCPPPSTGYDYTSSDLLPPSLQSDAIADTIKLFFPVAAAATSSSNYQPPDLLSCPRSHTQDLRLSLQSFQDPIPVHSQSTSSAPLTFLAPGSEPTCQWNPGSGGGDIFNLEAAAQPPQQHASAQPPHAVPLHRLLVQGTAMLQGGTLQSNGPQPFRSWGDLTAAIQNMEIPGYAPHGFPGFRIPARIQGEDEHASKPSPSTLPSSHR